MSDPSHDPRPAPGHALAVPEPGPDDIIWTPSDYDPAEILAGELELAEVADGVLPRFLNEQRRPKTAAQLAAEEHAARMARGEAAIAKRAAGQPLTQDEFADECYSIDPISNSRRRRRPR